MRALKEGKIVGLANHTVLIAKNGSERPIDDSAAPIRDESGTIIGAVLVFRDISERKRTDRGLRTSEVRRRRALDAAELGSWNIDPAKNSLLSDERFRMILHGSTDPLSHEEAFAAIHPDDMERVQTRIGKALRDRAPFEETYRIRGATGDSRTVIARGMAEYDVHGQAIMLPGAVLDITRQIQAEEKLRESEERLRFALKAARTGTWELDARNDRFSCCDACKQNFGRGGSESFTYQELIASIHPEDRQRFLQTMDHAMRQAGEFDVEYRAHWPDESEHWVQMRGNGTAHANGRTTTLSSG